MKGNMMNWDLTIPHAILHAEKYNFDGIVCSDWALITDRLLPNGKVFKPASAFGLEDKTTEERITKLIDAGGKSDYFEAGIEPLLHSKSYCFNGFRQRFACIHIYAHRSRCRRS